jgi:hypothetical protein
VLADLSVNHVERQILLRGFALNRLQVDYGLDLMILTYNDGGELDSGHVLFQIKATDSLQVLKTGPFVSLRVELADLKAWQEEWMPVILVVYDGRADDAYWLFVQQYLDEKNVAADDFLDEQDRIVVRIPLANRLNPDAIGLFREIRIQYVQYKKGGFPHDA